MHGQACLPAGHRAAHSPALHAQSPSKQGSRRRREKQEQQDPDWPLAAQALALRPDFPEAFANLVHSLQCICDWTDRPSLFLRLENEVRRDLAAGRLPPVQPFHAMAYPFSAELALAISAKYVLSQNRGSVVGLQQAG